MFSSIAIITLIIIGLNIAISINGFNNPIFFNRYKFNTQAILSNKQVDRLLTSGFLHVDFNHLLFNMLTLYFFANPVISFFSNPYTFTQGFGAAQNNVGYIMFLLLFILSIIGGNFLALYFHRKNPYYNAVGASGGVSGVLFAAIAIEPNIMLGVFFIIPMPGWIFAILYLAYSVYAMKKQLGNIGHSAHIGGALLGLLIPLFFYPELIEKNLYYILGMLLPIVALTIITIKEIKN